MRHHRITPAERVAVNITKLLSDLHLDIEQVGYYVYRTMPPLVYNRFKVIAEAAEHEQKLNSDSEYAREYHRLGIY